MGAIDVSSARQESSALVHPSLVFTERPGACFSKTLRTFRARKACCQTAIHLF